MNEKLYMKLKKEVSFEDIFKKKGYAFFTKGDYNLNIIGVRAKVEGNKVTNAFDDFIVCIYNENGRQIIRVWEATTEPGLYYMVNNMINKKGTAILVPDQYRGCWKIGKHNCKYLALVQAKPVKVYRDSNKDDVYDLDPSTIESGTFGINIHRSVGFGVGRKVDYYSAGCQVFANITQFNDFMSLVKLSAKLYGNSFTYTLINEEDLD